MKPNKNQSQFFLPLYLMGNGMVTGQFLRTMRVIAARGWNISQDETALLIFMVGAMWLSADRAIHCYKVLYKGKQK